MGRLKIMCPRTNFLGPLVLNINRPWNIMSLELYIHVIMYMWWGDETSRNDVSLYEFSGTPGPQINRPIWHNIPGLIHPRHFASYNTFRLVQIDRDVSMQGHCVSGTIHLGDEGSQNIWTGTHRFRPSRHPTIQACHNTFMCRKWKGCLHAVTFCF